MSRSLRDGAKLTEKQCSLESSKNAALVVADRSAYSCLQALYRYRNHIFFARYDKLRQAILLNVSYILYKRGIKTFS